MKICRPSVSFIKVGFVFFIQFGYNLVQEISKRMYWLYENQCSERCTLVSDMNEFL
jgi:hypothetical protein